MAGAAFTALNGTVHAQDHAQENARLTSLALHDSFFTVALTAPLNGGIKNMYASHASHSSHASHASHSSGSSGVYRSSPDTSPSYSPSYAAPASTATTGNAVVPLYGPTESGVAKPSSPRPTPDQLRMMIMRVQAALYARGYDPGAIDGVLSEMTKRALGRFQLAHGLPATYTMTTATLNALGVALN